MRLLVLSTYGFDAYRSAAQSLRELVVALAQRGHTLDVLVPRAGEPGDDVAQLAPGLTLHRIAQSGGQIAALKLLQWVPVIRNSGIEAGVELVHDMVRRTDEISADVVLSLPPPGPAYWTALYLHARRKLPVIQLPAETAVDEWMIRTPVTDRLIRSFQHCVSNPLDQAELLRIGCDPASVHLLHPFIELPASHESHGPGELSPRAREIAHKFELPDAPRVMFLGRQNQQNDIETVLRAMPRVWPEIPEARLVLAGDPTVERDELLHRLEAADARFRSHVHRVDRFDEADRTALLELASLVAVTGRRDPLARSCLAAWAAWRVPVGDPLGGGWIIAHNRNGLLASSGNPATLARAWRELLGDPALRDNMAAVGHRQLMRQHTVDHAAATVEAVARGALAAVTGHRAVSA